MAQHSELPRKANSLDADQVATFLRAHPNFLNEYPDLIEMLVPPTRRTEDGVVDMQRFMVERLRGQVDLLRSVQHELLSTTRTNQDILTRIHAAVVAVIAANSFERLIHLVTHDLARLLDVDVVSLCVEATADSEPPRGVHLLPGGAVDALLGPGNNALLQADAVANPAVFGIRASHVRSQALVRLNVGVSSPPGLVAFGSLDPNGYSQGHSTELMQFLAQVLENTIRAWLDLPS